MGNKREGRGYGMAWHGMAWHVGWGWIYRKAKKQHEMKQNEALIRVVRIRTYVLYVQEAQKQIKIFFIMHTYS